MNPSPQKHAVLLPNMVEFPSMSMKRYARELTAALRALDAPDWRFDDLECRRVEELARIMPGKMGEAWASRAGRFMRYPRMAKEAAKTATVCHVLDHSHANLVFALPPEKSVLTVHDVIPLLAARGLIPIPSGRFTRLSFPLIRLRAMKKTGAVIAISENTKRDLIEHGGIAEEKITVVYYGVNKSFGPVSDSGTDRAAERRALLSERHGIPDPDAVRIILQVATATRYKNTPAILNALQSLRQDKSLGDNVYLLRVGADFYPDEAEMVRGKGLTDRVIHAGPVYDDALLARYYRAADVFAFPSIWEGFGWPPLEAMACGTPVVTSNIASLPEVVGDAGITVDPQDHAGLARGLHEILTQPEKVIERREKCLRRATRFTWEKCASGTLSVYNRLTNGL